jgi:hypothetical protein
MPKVRDDAASANRANTIIEIRAEMDAILDQVVWLLCPGLKDGTETLHERPAVQERAFQLLSIGSFIDHSDAAIVDAAIRWLQLAEALGRLNAQVAVPKGNARAGLSADRPAAGIQP